MTMKPLKLITINHKRTSLNIVSQILIFTVIP